jgi:hypothetical protein
MKKLLKKVGKALKKAGPSLVGAKVGSSLGKKLLAGNPIGGIAGGVAGAKLSKSLGSRLKKVFRGRSKTAQASAPQEAPGSQVSEDNRAGMSGGAGLAGFKRGGLAAKKGRAMTRSGADAMGRAMAKKPAAKKMMGGGMARGYRSGGMAKKTGRGC